MTKEQFKRKVIRTFGYYDEYKLKDKNLKYTSGQLLKIKHLTGGSHWSDFGHILILGIIKERPNYIQYVIKVGREGYPSFNSTHVLLSRSIEDVETQYKVDLSNLLQKL